MLDQVAAIVQDVAAQYVLPRFRNLTDGDVIEKAPGDLVTVADRDAEAALTRRLSDLLPGSVVVGEEAAAADPAVLSRLVDDETVWLVDPVDGTGNFAAGREPFAVMVALVRRGEPVLAVVHEPVPGSLALAERGAGVTVDGTAVTMAAPASSADQLTGALLVRYLPEPMRTQLVDRSRRFRRVLPGWACAGHEYPQLLRGAQDFAVFWRGLPWDHTPGALLVREGGGVARYFDGSDYSPARIRRGLLVCRSEEVYDLVRRAIID